jgi:hypothetical protein
VARTLLLVGVAAIVAGGLGLGMLVLWIVPGDEASEWGLLPLALAGLMLLGTVLLIGFVVRVAAWLEGTRLTVWGLRTRTVSSLPTLDRSGCADSPPVTALLVFDDRALCDCGSSVAWRWNYCQNNCLRSPTPCRLCAVRGR